MKQILLLLISLLLSSAAYSQVKVKGYYKKNGTYVAPHYRSKPDKKPYNNYSYPSNINPYTGVEAKGKEETYLNNYYNNKATTNNYLPILPPPPLKISEVDKSYYADEQGNKSFYTVPSYTVTVSNIYSLDNRHIGYSHDYSNGVKYVYDIKYELIKTVFPKVN